MDLFNGALNTTTCKKTIIHGINVKRILHGVVLGGLGPTVTLKLT